MEIQNTEGHRRINALPTLPMAQCDTDLHLNLNAINADWFSDMTKELSFL